MTSVSIIVLNWNRPDMTLSCVDSILRNSGEADYQLVVVDNGSSRENVLLLEAGLPARAELLRLETNRFFGEGNNIGAEFASGEILIFLNNDVEVTDGWLSPLTIQFEQPGIGIVGSMLMYPDGRVQEVGAYLDGKGDPIHRGKMLRLPDKRFEHAEEVDYVSAAALAIRRSVFESVGGFHYAYEPAYYEDTELCYAVRSLGLKVIVEPSSKVVHFENQSTPNLSQTNSLSSFVSANRALFLRRLESGQLQQDASYSLGSEIMDHSKCGEAGNAVLYSPFQITPGGGEKYLLSIADALHRDGYRVTLALDEVYSKLRLEKIQHELSVPSSVCDCLRFSELTFVPDVFVSMGNEVVPTVPAVGKRSVFHCQFPFPIDSSTLKSRRGFLDGYDLVVVNSEYTRGWYEANLAGEVLPPKPTVIINPPVSLVDAQSEGAERDSYAIVSIGRFFRSGHSKRHDVMIDAFREVVQKFPQASLTLIGSSMHTEDDQKYISELMEQAKGLPIRFMVDAGRSEVEAVVKAASIYWHAAGIGVNAHRNPERLEHFGIAIVEAMSAGLIPVVFDGGGPRSIVTRGRTGLRYRTRDELSLMTEELLASPQSQLEAMRQAAVASSTQYSESVFRHKWSELVADFMEGSAKSTS